MRQSTGAIFACDRVISELRLLIVEGGDVTRLDRGRDDDEDGRDAVELAASVEALHSKIQPHPKHVHSKPPPRRLPRLLPTVDIRIRDRITSSVARCRSPTLALHHV